MAKKLLSEQQIAEASRRGEKIISISAGTIVTDAARDRAKQLGIRLVAAKDAPQTQTSPAPSTSQQSGEKAIIAIGSDHGGFALKELLKPFVENLGYKVVDVGTYSEEACDYPDFAYAVARTVSLGQASKGIMIDAVGIASAIVAKKLRGILAACCCYEFLTHSSPEHQNS